MTLRVVLEMSQPTRAFVVRPGSQSGHPLRPRYGDQLGVWIKGELSPLASTPEDAGPITNTLHPVTVAGP